MISVKGIEVKTSVKEMTLDEYNQFGLLVGNEKITRNVRWLLLLKYLGKLDESDLMDISVEEMQTFVDHLNESTFNFSELPQRKEVEHGGRVYVVADELSFYDLAKVEEVVKEGGMWFAKAMAILFKDTQLTNKEHYVPAHQKLKATIFSNMPAVEFIPTLARYQSQVFENQENEANEETLAEVTEAME